MTGLTLLLAACQVPVGSDRHDLAGDRIAAMAVAPARMQPGTRFEARIALIVQGRPWSDDPVVAQWHHVDDLDDVARLEPGDDADATGAAPVLVGSESPILAVVATFPSGAVERAFLELERGDLRDPPALELSVAPGPVVEAGDTLTLTAEADGDPLARWMSVAGRGTFTELDRASAAWEAAEVEVDDGEVVSRDPLAPGAVTVLALVVDERGGNAFVAEELWVGEPDVGLWTTSGRFLPSDVAPPARGPWAGTLYADDDAPAGLGIGALVPVLDLSGMDPWRTTTLPCSPQVSGPFDPTWLLEGRCLRQDLAGHTVVVDVR